MWRWLLLLVLTGCGGQVIAREPGTIFPAAYRETFVHYARVDRIDGTVRDLYVSPGALDAVSGPLPVDTTFVIEGYYAAVDEAGAYLTDEAGRFIIGEPFETLHIIQKRGDWTAADFPGQTRAGDWNFGSFRADTGQRFDEDLLACFNCHNASPRTDFIYSRPLLTNYRRTGLVQYFFCNVSARVAC